MSLKQQNKFTNHETQKVCYCAQQMMINNKIKLIFIFVPKGVTSFCGMSLLYTRPQVCSGLIHA
jgi:hypothetical protein